VVALEQLRSLDLRLMSKLPLLAKIYHAKVATGRRCQFIVALAPRSWKSETAPHVAVTTTSRLEFDSFS
jgi:hypothetical protein